MKKFLCFASLLLISVLCCGCASINYSRVVMTDGKIEDKLEITLNAQILTANGYNASAILNAIEVDIVNFYFAPIKAYLKEVAANNLLTQQQKANILQNIIISTTKNAQTYNICACTTFNNEAVFGAYNKWQLSDSPQSPQKPPQIENGVYFNKYVQVSDSAFYDVINSPHLAPIFNKYKINLGLQNKFDITDIHFSQIYGSTNTKIKSNANLTKTVNNVKFHYWNIFPTNPQKLKFYSYVPNISMWYVTALVASLATAFAILLYYKKPKSRFPKNKKVLR